MARSIERVVVIGAGTMGHGIAQVLAMAGCRVSLNDREPAILHRARMKVEANLKKGVDRGKVGEATRAAALKNLTVEADLAAAVRGADLVIEAVVEELALKQRLLAEVERQVDDSTILASNTSSLPLTQIAAALSRPGRLIGMHFFNPVHIMRLVELVVHDATDAEVCQAALALVERVGKDPIVVKDSPGFASSRLGVVLGLEAMRMLEQGVASAADIDKAMELGYKHPMGPLRLTDLVGLDVRLAVAETLFRELEGEQYRPPAILKEKVAAGEVGKKAGKGFYDW